jgi:hypothetical protein
LELYLVLFSTYNHDIRSRRNTRIIELYAFLHAQFVALDPVVNSSDGEGSPKLVSVFGSLPTLQELLIVIRRLSQTKKISPRGENGAQQNHLRAGVRYLAAQANTLHSPWQIIEKSHLIVSNFVNHDQKQVYKARLGVVRSAL